MNNSIYDFTVLDVSGNLVKLKDYEGKVILIVNTASECYFTKQYRTLEKLYNKFKDQGFVVLAFPSNDFRGQEPLSGGDLESFCRIDQRATFPIFDRVHVKGDSVCPLFDFLSRKELNGVFDSKPSWNFHKYLIAKDGRLVDYFYPFTSPVSSKIEHKIGQLLAE